MSENNEINETADTPKEPETTSSCNVAGVRFRSCGKVYTFRVDDLEVAKGMRVVVESDMGISLGHIAIPKHTVERSKEKLKKVLRIADEKDLEAVEKNRILEEEARLFCAQKAKEYKLDMKLVTTETTLDKKRLIFYFTADGRIDFRELVRDLAAKFKTRIEMRQIGVRDEVKMLGGLGVCGRQACCNLFLTSFEPVTIKMAKGQALSINQSKLSGICGRLMCCLGYEYNEGDVGRHVQERERRAAAARKAAAEAVTAGEDQVPAEDRTVPAIASGRPVEHDEAAAADGAAPSEDRKSAEDNKDRPAGKRRRRRRRPRQAGGQQGENRAPEGQAAPAPAARPQSGGDQPQSAEKDKGRAFSKRRKFWKKKKS
ncbi:MAG: regulatory iron-sulfur-containing complex subunit RicT [Nitrospirota bacterium]|nr:regulatory iron-sulfur-containing complex subunit RicT [Nitrospirota bacterium]